MESGQVDEPPKGGRMQSGQWMIRADCSRCGRITTHSIIWGPKGAEKLVCMDCATTRPPVPTLTAMPPM